MQEFMKKFKSKSKFIGAAGALAIGAVLCGGSAQAGVIGGADAIRSASELGALVEPVQFIFGGAEYCWYPDGWHGPGWYRCGYGSRVGFGWGGPVGWNNWHFRDHDDFRREHDHDHDDFRFRERDHDHDHDHHDHDHDRR